LLNSGAAQSRPSSGVVLVIGASSGIGREVAYALSDQARSTILASRDEKELQTVAGDLSIRYAAQCHTLALDLTLPETHADRLSECLRLAGHAGLAGVILCSGFSGDQKRAEVSWAETRHILEANFLGCVSLLNQLAEYFEARRSGFICVVTSVAGDRGRQSNYIYGAAKAGMAAYLQGVRNRLHESGISVITIKPGYVDTPMTFGKPGTFLVAKPASVARSILTAIQGRKHVTYTPWFWWWIMLAIRSIPEPAFKRLRL
jgi:decaprenylphospho-beta-D-erythro-pentofuranosid-2-ulose 2-reductase